MKNLVSDIENGVSLIDHITAPIGWEPGKKVTDSELDELVKQAVPLYRKQYTEQTCPDEEVVSYIRAAHKRSGDPVPVVLIYDNPIQGLAAIHAIENSYISPEEWAEIVVDQELNFSNGKTKFDYEN
jgi:hypothetical protein